MAPVNPEYGSHPLEGTGDLPNVHVIFPGEHWSDAVASGDITPGEAVITDADASGTLVVRPVVQSDNGDPRVAIAKHVVEAGDPSTGPSAVGPIEIVNSEIKSGEYVHRYLSGAFALTLVDPRDDYKPGDILGWDIDGERPQGKTGAGSWRKSGSNTDVDDIFEVQSVREYGSNGEVILNVRSLRGQF